jgi:phenylacetate-coenzyme A ligase PaaK-like adenylate-forming protein
MLANEIRIKNYIKTICSSLLFQDPKIIRSISKMMKENIEEYAKKHTKVYAETNKIFTRKDFEIKDNWLSRAIDEKRVMSQNTSGSTTGKSFSFHNDKKYFEWIQDNAEFDLILKEYGLHGKHIKILNLLKYPFNPKLENFFLETKNFSQHKFHSFSAKNFTTFFVDFSKYSDDPDLWHEQLLDLFDKNRFDIILCSGPVLNVLIKYIKKNNFKKNICHLLSHTTQFPRQEDFEFLKNNGNIDHFCDHMRCWDGGVTFFTCKFGTRHLLDNFSWAWEGENKKLICTDYFNLATPFINYWNGDLCEIIDEYQKCECGRFFRPFKMLQNRPFEIKGPTRLIEIQNKINNLEFKDKISQVQFDLLNVNIHAEKLNKQEIFQLEVILKDFILKIYS